MARGAYEHDENEDSAFARVDDDAPATGDCPECGEEAGEPHDDDCSRVGIVGAESSDDDDDEDA